MLGTFWCTSAVGFGNYCVNGQSPRKEGNKIAYITIYGCKVDGARLKAVYDISLLKVIALDEQNVDCIGGAYRVQQWTVEFEQMETFSFYWKQKFENDIYLNKLLKTDQEYNAI